MLKDLHGLLPVCLGMVSLPLGVAESLGGLGNVVFVVVAIIIIVVVLRPFALQATSRLLGIRGTLLDFVQDTVHGLLCVSAVFLGRAACVIGADIREDERDMIDTRLDPGKIGILVDVHLVNVYAQLAFVLE